MERGTRRQCGPIRATEVDIGRLRPIEGMLVLDPMVGAVVADIMPARHMQAHRTPARRTRVVVAGSTAVVVVDFTAVVEATADAARAANFG